MDLESQTITPAVAVLDPKEDLEVVVVEEDLEEAAGGLEISRTVTTTMEVEGDLEEGPQVEDLEVGPRVEDLEPKRRVDLGAGDLDQRTMANLLDLEEVRIEQCGINIPRCGNLNYRIFGGGFLRITKFA